MGGTMQPMSPYATDAALIAKVVDREELLQLADYENKVEVSFANTASSNPYRHLYTVMLNRRVPRTCPLHCVFPQHPLPKCRVLCTADYGAMHELGIELNARIVAARSSHFYVLSGEYAFRISE